FTVTLFLPHRAGDGDGPAFDQIAAAHDARRFFEREFPSALALIPAMAAREVAVSALATANAIDAGDDEDKVAQSLSERLQ
ncbi:hypothetical protein, partial [Acinetobacter schindleri]|uniref:hypothetical protein n=1 Tax=Acinetobacter schindleri TaxID=108981 RepID=UPI0030F891FA